MSYDGRFVRGWETYILLLGLFLMTARIGVIAESFIPPEIHVAEGFEVGIAAAPPLVGYPLMACFDDRGRLYVAESDGQNLTKKEEYLRQRPRFVRRLEDVDGDGRFDRQTIFADQMTMPEGGFWYRGALYIVSAPYLWRLEDLDDDGVADRREKILGYMEFDGRANQHGPYLGPNGRLYFSGGHFGFDFVGRDGSRTGRSRSAGVFSCWPDGTDVRVEGQGPVNPVDVVFTPEGEMLSTCAIYDSVGGRHDAIVHWVPGGLTQRVYGDPVLSDSGFRLPSMTRWGQVAPGGFARYRGSYLGSEMTDTYVACHFNGHKVVNVTLDRQGASFVSHQRDLLWSDNVDFHPADVLEDADGSLLVLDTGAWLSWGCPYSKIAKPEIRGAIYRIRKKDGARVEDPRGEKLAWKVSVGELISRLADARPALRDRASELLVEKGAAAVGEIAGALDSIGERSLQRRLIWALSRIEDEAALAAIRLKAKRGPVEVQHAAVRSLGIREDREAVSLLIPLLSSDEPSIRRVAASALGQIGEPTATRSMLTAAAIETDHYVNHALVYGLIQLADVGELRAALLGDSSSRTKAMALRVLHRRPDGGLQPAEVLSLLEVEGPFLRQEALAIVGERPEWEEAVATVFREWRDVEGTDRSVLVERLVPSLLSQGRARGELMEALLDSGLSSTKIDRLLESLGRQSRLPDDLIPVVEKLFQSDRPEALFRLLALVPRFSSDAFIEPLRKVASNSDLALSLRVRAAALSVDQRGDLPLKLVYLLSNRLKDPDANPLERREAARALGRIRFGAKRTTNIFPLVDVIPSLNSFEMEHVLTPFESFDEMNPRLPERFLESIGERLLTQLEEVAEEPGLDAVKWRRVFSAFKDQTQRAAHALLANQEARHINNEDRLHQLIARKDTGNASRGRALFFGGKGACISCHRMEGRGGTVGPDLSQIGSIRQKRDLFEAILSPSSTLVNGYETCTITLKSGDVIAGVVSAESDSIVTLKDAAQQETQVRRSEIATMALSRLSLMPEGLAETMSPQELQDLVDFLWHCREP